MKLIYLCTLLHVVFAQDLLGKFQICKRSDPKLKDCLKDAIQKALTFIEHGVPEFKIPSMQPIEVSAWTVNRTKEIPYRQKYDDIRMYNFATALIEEVEPSITDDKFAVEIKGNIPVLKFVAQYLYENAIFMDVNISGKGTLLFIEVGNKFRLNMEGQVNRNGNTPILEITSATFQDTIDYLDINLEHSHFELSRTNNAHLNKNWELIFNELTAGYSQIYTFGFKNVANAIFSQIDYDKLFPK